MRIALIGATGQLGRRVAAEAWGRGHAVDRFSRTGLSGIARPARGGSGTEEPVARIDAGDSAAVAAVADGADLVLACTRPPHDLTEQREQVLRNSSGLLDGCASAGTPLLLVGGCGSLRSPNDPRLLAVDDPAVVPEQWRPIARACLAQWELCREHPWRGWTHACPPAILAPGSRTGRYVRGHDTVLTDQHGDSAISMEDFAIALLDEAENPRATGDRFTVAGSGTPAQIPSPVGNPAAAGAGA